MPVAMVAYPPDAKTGQQDETTDEQDADDLPRYSCPAIHLRYRQEVDRRFPVDDLDRIACIDEEQ